MKESMLYISTHLPSLSFPQAGHKTAFSLLKDYSDRYEIIVVFFINQHEMTYYDERDYSFCREVHITNVNIFTRITGIILHPFIPVNEAMRKSGEAGRIIREIQRKYRLTAVHFEFTASAVYAGEILPGVKKIYSEHDLTFQAIERKLKQSKGLKKYFYGLEFKRQKKWEMKAAGGMDLILVHNPKDRLILLQEGLPGSRIKVIDPYINPVFKTVKRDSVEKYSILFWGAMNRPENIDAVEWFVKNIFPGIITGCPEAKLYIVGANPPESIKKLENKNVAVTGFVENPLPYFEKAHVAVAPLRLGAGVKVKVLEALAAGLPVIATGIGAEGIGGDKLFIADDPGAFIELVLEKLK